MATAPEWFAGARPRTLPAAIAPVAVGTGLAAYADAFVAVRAVLALLVAIALQVGVNFANDYSDGIRGTDAVRVGPVRLVGQRLASPGQVRAAAVASLGVAAVAGLVLVALCGQWWLLLIGAASVAAAWLYTGGPHPYGYAGLGEVFVFGFFGVVPVVFTAYVQTLTITWADLIASVGVGALACAILVANNLRDIPGDTEAGKNTLAVRLGDARTRVLYLGLIGIGVLAPIGVAALTSWTVALASLSGVLAIPAIRRVTAGARGPALIAVLKGTSLLLLAYGIVLGGLIALA